MLLNDFYSKHILVLLFLGCAWSSPAENPYLPVVRCKTPANHRRPVVIFIAGTEGSGHHGIYFALKDSGIPFVPQDVTNLLTVMWDPTFGAKDRRTIKWDTKRRLTGAYEGCVKQAIQAKKNVTQSCGYFLIGSHDNVLSFPYGGPRNVMRRPDLQDLIETLEDPNVGISFDVRIIFLYRHPMSAAMSNRRRKFVQDSDCLTKHVHRNKFIEKKFRNLPCSGLFYLMREVEDNLVILNSEASILSSQYFRVLQQKDFLQKPHSETIEAISHFLSFDEKKKEQFSKSLPKLLGNKPKHGKNKFYSDGESEVEHMLTILTSIRRERWAHLTNGRFDLYEARLAQSDTGENTYGYKCANLSTYSLHESKEHKL
eukprot:m.221369 g.221369  ORF g.221369 m.221369 type:complete len:370 (+) comp15926_c0_seq7:126-1235(+)